ncbi:MAG: two-component regulator propeller domain-containing protein [Bacteroidia bacterium]
MESKQFVFFLKNYLLATLFLATFSSAVFSQNTTRFNRITSEQGLSQSVVNCILEDNKGFMWFGTQDGLNKYDGYETTVFKHNPVDSNSLSNNFIYSLYQDENNILWIGTNGSGLDGFDLYTRKFKHYETNLSDTSSISNNNVWTIIEGNDGLLWMGTDYGLNSFDRKTHQFKRYFNHYSDSSSTAGNMIYALHQDKDGTIWVGTGAGLYAFNTKNGHFKNYPTHDKNAKISDYLRDKIKGIYEDKKNNLWIATDGGGLGEFDIATKTFEHFLQSNPIDSSSLSSDHVTSIVQDPNGKLWIGSFYGGITCYDVNENQFTRYYHDDQNPKSLVNNDVKCLCMDRQGILWIGTQSGISLHFKTSNQFTLYKNNSTKQGSNCVMGLMQDRNGLLWLSTNGAGIFTLDQKSNTYTPYAELTKGVDNNAALSLFQDKEGIVWVGTWGNGLAAYNEETKTTVHYNQSNSPLKGGAETVTCITQDPFGLLWFGTYGGGLFSFNKKTGQFTNYTMNNGLSSNNIYCVFVAKNKNLWIGTDGGGILIRDAQTGKITTLKTDKTEKNSLSANTVYCVYEDKSGMMWLGTNIGLDKYNPFIHQFTDYFEKDGLPNDVIYGILPDADGNLWMSTNKGLSRFNPNASNTDGSAFRNYDVNDGLQGKEFNQGAYFKGKSGELFFGGVNGVNSFFPNKIKGNEHIPLVYITSYKLFGKEAVLDTAISSKKYIQLSWKDNFFSFDFVALDYEMPLQNKYQYKLDGVDEDWSPPTTRRFASYTQLSGGDYVLHVRACNNDGVWNNKGTVLYIRIIPPFWRTKWFYTLCILLIITGVFGFIRYRTRSIQKEKKILENKVNERTKELAQKNKDITSSIRYAKRIQEAILPPQKQIFSHFKNAFIVYKPKDIVSGDFYWFAEKGEKTIIATVDCTGHGVPGAFMSMIGHNLLNQIVIEKGIISPSEILNELHHGVQSALKQGEHNIDTNDGMDIALCAIDVDKREVQFAGAYRPLFIINNTNFEKIEPDKFPIGGTQMEFKPFTNHTKKLKEGDAIYIFSDGYADQFGGKDGKKFMVKRFQELLISSQTLSMQEQGKLLDTTIENWKGDFQQVDDILVIGIRL